MPKTVGVAVSNATFHFDKLYTYAVMPDQQDAVRLGSMVLVPFGLGSRARRGAGLRRRTGELEAEIPLRCGPRFRLPDAGTAAAGAFFERTPLLHLL